MALSFHRDRGKTNVRTPYICEGRLAIMSCGPKMGVSRALTPECSLGGGRPYVPISVKQSLQNLYVDIAVAFGGCLPIGLARRVNLSNNPYPVCAH